MGVRDVGTVTPFVLEDTVEGRYDRCELLNSIQHIDIFGRFRSSQRHARAHLLTSVSSNSSRGDFSSSSGSLRPPRPSALGRLTSVSRTSALYPGHDILGRKNRPSSPPARY